jgi:D-serine deaminase-like pyridoxal phosphate-dependent protein
VNLWDLDTPALVIDLDRVEANVQEMAERARVAGVRLRPHTKTHKMPEIARLQVAAGARGITCAKLGEAEVMADAGFDDILVAYPLVGATKLERLGRLRERARVIVSLDSLEAAGGVGAVGVASGDPVEVYVEVDTGQHRLGRPPGAPTAELVARVAEVPGVRVLGLMTHAGHAYHAPVASHEALIDDEIAALEATLRCCAELGIALGEVSLGSTPTVRREMQRGSATEARPGTYVFNDTTMIDLGAATAETCAAHVLATVVSRPREDRIVLDAGSKCFSSDGDDRPRWLRVPGRDDITFEFINEEHAVAVVDLDRGRPPAIGDKLLVIPAHVCPVVNLFDSVTVVRGEAVEGELVVAGRGRVR